MKIEFRPIADAEFEGVLLAEPFKGTCDMHIERHDNRTKKERFVAVVLDAPQILSEYCSACGNTPNWALQQAINQAEAYIKRLEGHLLSARANVLLAQSILDAEFVFKEEKDE